MSSQNTLTAPNDRDKKHVFNFNEPVLTEQQTIAATRDLVNKEHLEMYPKTERAFADPSIDDQEYCLVSFIPSIEAQPDKDGIYGMIKVRGTYNSLEKCDKRSEYIIKNIDSVHPIYYAGVGKPFPITNSSKFSKDINKIKIQEKMVEDKKQKEEKEKKEIEEIKQREAEIMEQNKSDKPIEVDPLDEYITNRVKKAQLTWTYLGTMKKLNDMRENILSTRDKIKQSDNNDPSLRENYLAKYNESLKSINLNQEQDSFIKYLENDAIQELGF